MKSLNLIKNIILKNKNILKERFKLKGIGVFGSYVKGKAQRESDIDILVEFTQVPDFFEFLRLEEFLTRLIGVKVDLVTSKALKPLIKKEILKKTIYVW